MKIIFAGIQLTDWSDYPAFGVQLNGQAVFDAADVLNAAQKKLFFRGNELVTLEFSVRREFATLADAQLYFLTFFSALTKSGTCEIVCGGPADVSPPSVFMENAVLAAVPQINFAGVEVVARYTIVAPRATSDIPVSDLTGAPEYYWSKITRLTGGVLATDLDAQPIAGYPAKTLIKVRIAGLGLNAWLKEYDDTNPATDLTVGRIRPVDYHAVDMPYVLTLQIGLAA